MSGYGIDLWHQREGQEELNAGNACLSCVLAGEPGNSTSTDKLTRYFESFALPAASGILSRAVFGASVDYGQSIAEFLKPQPAFQKSTRPKSPNRYR